MTAIKPRTARVVIYQGDDLARLRKADEAVVQAESDLNAAKRAAKNATGRTVLITESQPDPVAAQQKLDAAIAERDRVATEADERGVAVVMHQLGRKEWRRLRNAHPPRDGNAEDEALDCNVDSFPDEVLPASICRDADCPICAASGERTTIDGELDPFLDSLSTHDYYQRLFAEVMRLNVGGAGANPTLRLGLTLSPDFAETSN